MLRLFGWVVRFFESLRAIDNQMEAVWLNQGWPERLKWWLGGSLGIAVFAFFVVCIPGTALIGINHLYHLLKGSQAVVGYAGLLNFAVGFALVALTIAFVSCPLFMVQLRHRAQ